VGTESRTLSVSVQTPERCPHYSLTVRKSVHQHSSRHRLRPLYPSHEFRVEFADETNARRKLLKSGNAVFLATK